MTSLYITFIVIIAVIVVAIIIIVIGYHHSKLYEFLDLLNFLPFHLTYFTYLIWTDHHYYSTYVPPPNMW